MPPPGRPWARSMTSAIIRSIRSEAETMRMHAFVTRSGNSSMRAKLFAELKAQYREEHEHPKTQSFKMVQYRAVPPLGPQRGSAESDEASEGDQSLRTRRARSV